MSKVMSEEEWAKIREFWVTHLNKYPQAAHHGLPTVRGDGMRGVCLRLDAAESRVTTLEGLLRECRFGLKVWAEEAKVPNAPLTDTMGIGGTWDLIHRIDAALAPAREGERKGG